MRVIRLVLLAGVAMLGVVVPAWGALPHAAAKARLAKRADVSTSHNKPGVGMVGPVVRASFPDGNQVGLWFYSSGAQARVTAVQAKATSDAFHTTIGTAGRVFFTWDHKPSAARAHFVTACLKR